MGISNRDRRAAKQRRRDQRRGHTPDATPDRGLSPEALHRVLSDAATDLAAEQAAGHAEQHAGHAPPTGAGAPPEHTPPEHTPPEQTLTELRHLLAEHLARRREQVLAACDSVLADVPPDDRAAPERTGPDPDALVAGLDAARRAGRTVTAWADRERIRAEDAAVTTVRVLARHRATPDA